MPEFKAAISRQYPAETANFTQADWDRITTYIYGGAIAPDTDHYELFDKTGYLFSDLAHCLLSGDLALTMRKLAITPEESAFAMGWTLGLLSDRIGHPRLVNPLAQKVENSPTPVMIPGNENLYGKIKLFLDGYWVTDKPRDYAFSLSLLDRAYKEVYGLSFGGNPCFDPPPHKKLIDLGMREFQAAWNKTEKRTHTTPAGLEYKIMTLAGKISLAIQAMYPPIKFGPVEKVFNLEKEKNEALLLEIFAALVKAAKEAAASQDYRLPNETVELAVSPLDDNGYGFSIRGAKAWLKNSGYDRVSAERSALLKAYIDKFLPQQES